MCHQRVIGCHCVVAPPIRLQSDVHENDDASDVHLQLLLRHVPPAQNQSLLMHLSCTLLASTMNRLLHPPSQHVLQSLSSLSLPRSAIVSPGIGTTSSFLSQSCAHKDALTLTCRPSVST